MPKNGPCDCGCTNVFTDREARDDLDRFRRQGADRTTRALIDALKAEGIAGATLLDVGGGIGAIQLELLAAGAASAESVDASEAYVATAREEAARRGYAERTLHRVGTLESLAGTVAAADVVTLDRVVCCDPDLPALLEVVTGRARRMIGLVFPRTTWWNRLAARAMAAWGWVSRDPTRWYLHSTEEVDGILRAAGFARRDVDRTFIWQVALYVREPAQPGAGGSAFGDV